MLKIQAIGIVGKQIETTPAGQTKFSVLVYETVELNGQTETKTTAILCSAQAERVKNIKTGMQAFIRGNGGAKMIAEKGKQYTVFTCKPSWIQFGKDDKSLHNIFIETIGYIGENRQSGHDGKLVCNFSVASNGKELNEQGEKIDVTTWVNCALWREPERAKIFDYLAKGTRVFVAGKPILRIWGDDKDKLSLECRVSEIELLGGKKDSEKEDENQVAPDDNQPVFEQKQDDLPF